MAGLVGANELRPPIDLVGAVVDLVSTGIGGPPVVGGAALELGPIGPPEPSWLDEWLVGLVHEQSVAIEDRRRRGAWYTPRSVVEGLVRVATDGWSEPPALITDRTCGGGAFLLAALDRLEAWGVGPATAATMVAGMDLDPLAVQVSRWSIELWLRRRLGPDTAAGLAAGLDIRLGDALAELPPSWCAQVVVVGNPPFASPLKKGTIPPAAARYRHARAELLGPYADLAAIHLLNAVDTVASGSTVALVQPQSVLASRDTEALRLHLGSVAPLSAFWAARELLFDAGVRACAPVLGVGAEEGPELALYSGPDVVSTGATKGATGERRWSGLAADALGAPPLGSLSTLRLGELCTATAGFRDEFYAMVGACRQAEPSERSGPLEAGVARVVTVGSVDPLVVGWGTEPTRFGGTAWSHPVIDRDQLPPKVVRWYDRLRRPKVLLATQSKLLEPVIDHHGDLAPATPVIAVLAAPGDLERVTAVLLAPPVALWAWRRWFGSALSVDALKLAAKQVAELPLPTDSERWAEAAELIARRDQAAGGGQDAAQAWDLAVEVATIMTEAYGVGPEVLGWWKTRLKPRPAPVDG